MEVRKTLTASKLESYTFIHFFSEETQIIPADEFRPTIYSSFQPGELWLDNNGVHINAHGGGLLYQNGLYYWFGEHKIAGDAGNLAYVGVHCYSSKDLYNWKDEGVALAVVKDNPDHPVIEGCVLERPKVVYNKNTRQYVMWFHLELKGQAYRTSLTGLAVASNVTGPYEFIKAIRPNKQTWPINVKSEEKEFDKRIDKLFFNGAEAPPADFKVNILARDYEKGQMSRDMTIFVDDDSKAYHIHASEENSCLHISLLTDDYLDFDGKYIRVFENRFMEAPALFKRKDRYYLIMSGCTSWQPNAARSAVADSIWGPWKELGNPCVGENAHKTFFSQSTYILPVQGKQDAFIFMADRWRPQNAIDGRYVWLPIEFGSEKQIVLRWHKKWDMSYFDSIGSTKGVRFRPGTSL